MTSHNLLHRVAEEGNLVRTHQRHHFSLLHYISFPANSPTCARRSTRTMNERLGVFRNVVVDNRGYSRNVDSASNRVGRNQNPFLAILKRPHRLVPLTRRQFRGIFCEKRLPRGSAHHQLHEQKHATGEKRADFAPVDCIDVVAENKDLLGIADHLAINHAEQRQWLPNGLHDQIFLVQPGRNREDI